MVTGTCHSRPYSAWRTGRENYSCYYHYSIEAFEKKDVALLNQSAIPGIIGLRLFGPEIPGLKKITLTSPNEDTSRKLTEKDERLIEKTTIIIFMRFFRKN